ncbi:MAG TPA: methyltransferase domain-containing protein [Candidatus Saccharibacteria bacterium]|nr:methyltransferase domain-containing protein [Candidatus Saccharibacteria bacterium]
MTGSELSVVESVLGVDSSIGSEAEAIRASFENLMGTQMTDAEFAMTCRGLTTIASLGGSLSPETVEAAIVLDSLKDVFCRDEQRHANTLVDWPSYQLMMEERGRKVGGVALLIGSISPLSSRAFEALATEVYGADSSVIIDVEATNAQKKQGTFVLGSGTDLPFASGSISYVHTNRLLHMLDSPGRIPATKWSAALELFREISRVLTPEGQVFMQETLPGDDYFCEADMLRFRKIVRGGLLQAGFDEVVTQPSRDPIGMGYLFDRSRDFGAYQTEVISGVIDIFAQKTK